MLRMTEPFILIFSSKQQIHILSLRHQKLMLPIEIRLYMPDLKHWNTKLSFLPSPIKNVVQHAKGSTQRENFKRMRKTFSELFNHPKFDSLHEPFVALSLFGFCWTKRNCWECTLKPWWFIIFWIKRIRLRKSELTKAVNSSSTFSLGSEQFFRF